MLSHTPLKIVIEGITEEGKLFRPRDWAERMSDSLSILQNRRVLYSPLLKPFYREGKGCLLVDPELKEHHPELYKSILQFAQTNKLRMYTEKKQDL